MTRGAGARLGMKEGAMIDDARWFAGIDWASQTHQACLIDAGGKIIGERAFAHGGAGLAELCHWLLAASCPGASRSILNRDSAGPRGGEWNASTINGNVSRGTGILNNELYIGRLVWDRLPYGKDPATGKRISRLKPVDHAGRPPSSAFCPDFKAMLRRRWPDRLARARAQGCARSCSTDWCWRDSPRCWDSAATHRGLEAL